MAANSTQNSGRKSPGRPFKKGQSGNPSGRPKKDPLLKEKADVALDELWSIAQEPSTPAKIRTEIYMWLHDKAYGKATQRVAGDDDEPPVISIVMSPEMDEYAR